MKEIAIKLANAKKDLAYWTSVRNGEIEDDLNTPQGSLDAMIEHLENKVKSLSKFKVI